MFRSSFYIGLTLFCLISLTVSAQRISNSLNSNWKFYKGDMVNLSSNLATIVHAKDIKWSDISLPHTYNDKDVLDDEPGYYRGITWYKRQLSIPAQWKNKIVYLHFEGVGQVAEVYVNGKKAGSHTGSYNAFKIKLNDFLNFEGGANVVEVKVDNSFNENIAPLTADFTFYGGIYRDVYLVTADPVHFNMDNHASAGVFITTPKVTAALADVNIKGEVSNASTIPKKALLNVELIDASGKVIATKQQNLKLAANANTPFVLVMANIKAPKLWSPENPYLYQVRTTITDGATKTVIDELTEPLGFRWFSFDAVSGFKLNGKNYKLIGASRHQDFKDKGNAISDAQHVRDVKLLKEMGGNFLRVAHYPQDPAILQACDRLGILASVEIPIVNQITENQTFTNNCLMMQTEMIRQHFNHPSVVIWAYMNEVLLKINYQKNNPKRAPYIANVTKLAEQLDSLTRHEDPSRYTMIVNHGDFELYHEAGLAELAQITGWNIYQGWYSGNLSGFAAFMDKHHATIPNQPQFITEFGADVDPRLHSFLPERFDKTEEYGEQFHQVYLKAIQDRPFVIGGAIWNLADFNSETRAEAMPHINNKGLMTTDRQLKAAYLYYQSQLSKNPYLKIASRNWLLRSGIADSADSLFSTQEITVYTNLKTISLRANGKVIGKADAVDGVARFKVPFVNGNNKLMVYDNDHPPLIDVIDVDFKLIPKDLTSIKQPFTELNVSLGDKRLYIDAAQDQVWLPEQAYTAGSWGYIGGEVFTVKGGRQPYGSAKNIINTEDDPIYETQRVGIEQFKLDVPVGKYEVTLLFAELLSNIKREELVYNLATTAGAKEEAGKRSFDVKVNGILVLDNLSSNNYLEPEKAFATKFTVTVTNKNGITLDFLAKEGKTILNGLQVRKIY